MLRFKNSGLKFQPRTVHIFAHFLSPKKKSDLWCKIQIRVYVLFDVCVFRSCVEFQPRMLNMRAYFLHAHKSTHMFGSFLNLCKPTSVSFAINLFDIYAGANSWSICRMRSNCLIRLRLTTLTSSRGGGQSALPAPLRLSSSLQWRCWQTAAFGMDDRSSLSLDHTICCHNVEHNAVVASMDITLSITLLYRA